MITKFIFKVLNMDNMIQSTRETRGYRYTPCVMIFYLMLLFIHGTVQRYQISNSDAMCAWQWISYRGIYINIICTTNILYLSHARIRILKQRLPWKWHTSGPSPSRKKARIQAPPSPTLIWIKRILFISLSNCLSFSHILKLFYLLW